MTDVCKSEKDYFVYRRLSPWILFLLTILFGLFYSGARRFTSATLGEWKDVSVILASSATASNFIDVDSDPDDILVWFPNLSGTL